MSAGKNVEFEISVEKLSVKFKGDLLSGERMYGEAAGAVTSLIAQKMLTAPPKAPPIITVEPAGARRKTSRRRRTPVIVAADAANSDETAVAEADASGEDTVRSAPRPGPGAQPLMATLKDQGFFNDAKRTSADVSAALAAKGHTFKPAEITTPLKRLTQQGVLKREKDPSLKQWVYFAA